MPSKRCHFLHGWVFPHDDLIQRVSVSRNDFVGGLREHEVAHLAAGVNVVYWLERMRVPEPYASVGGAATSGEESCLVWVPGKSFDCCLVVAKPSNRLLALQVPDHKFVVVASACQLLSIERPFETTYFLLVPVMAVGDGVRCTEVSAEYHPVSRASAHSGSVPRNCANSSIVAFQSSH